MAISNGHVSFKRPAWLGDSITANNGLATVHYHDILVADWDVERSDNLGIFWFNDWESLRCDGGALSSYS